MAVHWQLQGYVRPADRAPQVGEGMAELMRFGESVAAQPCVPGPLPRDPAVWASQFGVPQDIVTRYLCPS